GLRGARRHADGRARAPGRPAHGSGRSRGPGGHPDIQGAARGHQAGRGAPLMSPRETNMERAGSMTERPHPVLHASWRDHVRAVDRALGKRDVESAQRAWESAHLAAVESLSWEGLLAAGEACLRIGGTIGARTTAEPVARRAYFAALYRACR